MGDVCTTDRHHGVCFPTMHMSIKLLNMKHMVYMLAYAVIHLKILIQISNRRNTSFRLAVENEGKPKPLIPVDDYQWPFRGSIAEPELSNTCFNVMVRRIARDFLTDELDRQYYADKYKCCPPPIFVPVITFLEVGFYLLKNYSVIASGWSS